MKVWKAETLLVFVTLVWGATFTFTKLGLQDSSVFFYIFIRFIIAFLVSFMFWGKHLLTIEKWSLKNGLVLGLLFGGGFLTQTLGLKYTTVTKCAFITGMAVVLTPLAFKLIIKKKISFWQWIGVAVSIIGLWIFTNPKIDNMNIGDVFTLISTFFWGFYLTYMDVFTKKAKNFSHTIQLVFMQFIVAAPFGLIGYLLFETGSFKFNITWNLVISLLFNGIIASVFLTIIHTSVQKFTTPVKAALIFTLEPVFATAIAFFALNEIMSSREVVGGSILFSAIIISEVGDYFANKFKSVIKV